MMRAFVLALMLGSFAAPAAAGGSSWSIGWSDYGRYGGYSVFYGRQLGWSYRSFSYRAPVWHRGGYGYDPYGYGGWDDPWFVARYAPRHRFGWYENCYDFCGRNHGYAPTYRGHSGYYAPPRAYYRHDYRDRGWRHDGHYRSDRYDRGDRRRDHAYDRRNRGYSSYKGQTRYDRRDDLHYRERDHRYRETAYERVRDHGYNAHDDAWRGQRQRSEW